MPYKDIKCRILEEELREFWPQWHVVRQISEGAFGAVYEIRKEEYGVEFRSALKVLHTASEEAILPTVPLLQQDDSDRESFGENSPLPGRAPNDRENARKKEAERKDGLPEDFRNEIKIMEALRGAPNVVTMEDVHFQTDGQTGTLYIRMELLTSLQTYVRSKPFLTVPEIIRIGIDICRALSFCEEKHIIHRDIKPANLFIDEFGTCKVGDFGVSRQAETVHAAHMMTGIGTISYMAPEIYFGKPYNNTVDIYALGLVLYQLLNRGRMPFMPDYPAECTTSDIDTSNYKRLHGEEIPQLSFAADPDGVPGPVSSKNTAAPNRIYKDSARALDKVIRRACSYRAQDRYRTATEMSYALDACRHPSEGKTSVEKSSEEKNLAGKTATGETVAGKSRNVPEIVHKKREDIEKSTRPKKKPVVSTPPGKDLGAGTNTSYLFEAEPSANPNEKLNAKPNATSPSKQKIDQKPVSPQKYPVSPLRGKIAVAVSKASKSSVPGYILVAAAVLAAVCLFILFIWVRKWIRGKELLTTWEDISAASEDGTYKEKYNIGDMLKLDLGKEGKIMMELVAMDCDELADGSGKAHMTWIAKDLLNTKHCMNMTESNKGGWAASEMRSWLREDVLPLFPEAVSDNIKEVTKCSYSYSDQGTVSSVDSIWIPSRREMFGAGDANEDKGVMYTDAYPDDDSRLKGHVRPSSLSWWWLRSASDDFDTDFSGVGHDGGGWTGNNASSDGGVAIGFCL